MKVKQTTTLAMLLAFTLIMGCSGGGCSFFAKIQPGHDPVVVNSERAQAITLEVVKTFLELEEQHRDFLFSVAPGIKAAANETRVKSKGVLDGLESVTMAYKKNRTLENKANLITWIETAEALKTAVLRHTVKAEMAILTKPTNQ